MKTRKDIVNQGFNLMATKKDGMEVWAKFTSYKDCVQFVYCKDNVRIGEVLEVTDLGRLMLFHRIYEGLTMGKDSCKRECVIPSTIWHEAWKDEMFK